MLWFFRKYQQYFYILVTTVVIISFSFFGTYSTINNNNFRDQPAFTAVDGTNVKRSELDQLVMFLGTDREDKLLMGGVLGPNFLNDGVLKKDILQTGLGTMLAHAYAGDINQDLQSKLEKEKRYTLYTHPQTKFLGVEGVWTHLAPDMKANFEALRGSESPLTDEAFQARVNLYLGELRLPQPIMRQILSYQQKQYQWITPDPVLERTDLSLFGYHTIEDWFGPRFTRLVAEFIINSSIIAEERGYEVTKAEALADLMNNAAISFKENEKNPYLGAANVGEYFQEQLHSMRLDTHQAAEMWQKVLLFRRLFHDMGSSVFVDPFAFTKISEYSKETIEGEVYNLPKELQLTSFSTLQDFETYLSLIAERPIDGKDLLGLPEKYFTVDQIAKQTPELVQKRYLLEFTKADVNELQRDVGVKETWNWEVDETNFAKIKEKFLELKVKDNKSREERFSSLEGLDDATRAKVDSFAREKIVEEHPEWIANALQGKTPEKVKAAIPLKGDSIFAGGKNNEELIKLLDSAPLSEQSKSLSQFTKDQKHFYRITVIDRSPNLEVATFAEVATRGGGIQGGVIQKALDKKLESYYGQIRDAHPEEFQKEDKSWKSFAEAKPKVVDRYFSNLLKAIRDDYAETIAPEKAPQQLIHEISASLRFNSYMNKALDLLQKNPQSASVFVAKQEENVEKEKLVSKTLAEQWKIEKNGFHVDRSASDKEFNLKSGFSLPEGAFSKVYTPTNGNIYFFQLFKKGNDASVATIQAKTDEAKKNLAQDAAKILMSHLLQRMKEKNSLTVDYLNQRPEINPEMNPEVNN